MTGVIDWTTSASISQSIGMYNRWRLAARLARKPRRCNMPLATAAVKGTAPINPNQQEQNTWGRPKTRPGPVHCGNHQSRDFYFPPPRDTSKKNRGKGQEKGTASWTDPALAAGTPARKNPTPPTTGAINPSSASPLRIPPAHSWPCLGGLIKKIAFSLGASDTVPYMERN
ncbi:hypothetical protein SEVIR_9G334750v4 [Setaria viridis]